MSKATKPLLRNRVYWLKRRVPKQFGDVEKRESIWISLHTDSLTLAEKKAAAAWQAQIDAWQARQDGMSDDAERRFTAAKRIAQRHGLAYLPQDQVLALPTDDLLARIEAIPEVAGQPDQVETAALLGKVPEPKISVSRALELYFEIARDKRLGKSDAQMRKWEAPIRQANRDFVEVVGDKVLEDLTRDDVRAFRDWWIEKIEADDLSPSTANKNMDHFGKVLKLVNEEKRLGLTLPLGGLRLDEGEKGKRPAFSEKWIRDRILALLHKSGEGFIS
ncbi:DUF6538 domain-containing protein [Gemmobacter nectariphilus]|uniref:DUF6538 domain-containing protein n=1 Tax=Gemmobacter nectariphilus TaxID=220343 RepID=UPI0006865F3E|nr:DUF6538 domain-containing protein [Gemmobacter nectariphilus]